MFIFCDSCKISFVEYSFCLSIATHAHKTKWLPLSIPTWILTLHLINLSYVVHQISRSSLIMQLCLNIDIPHCIYFFNDNAKQWLDQDKYNFMGNTNNPRAKAPWGKSQYNALEIISLFHDVPCVQVAIGRRNIQPTS